MQLCALFECAPKWAAAMEFVKSPGFKANIAAFLPEDAPSAAVDMLDSLLEDDLMVALLQSAGDVGACAGALAAWILSVSRAITASLFK